MTYQAIQPFKTASGTTTAVRKDFRQAERMIFLTGAGAFGAGLGFAAAVMMGRQDLLAQMLASAPLLALALLLAGQTFVQGARNQAFGCVAMATLHGGALVIWPVLVAMQNPLYWTAPVTAVATVVLLASCWKGSSAAIYRSAGQMALVAGLASYQGVLSVLGS